MTKHTAGLLGSLTDEALRSMTDAQLATKAAALEADGDEISTADEADLNLIWREQERRENAPEQPLGWFFVTIESSTMTRVVLVQAAAGADVEDTLKRHGFEALTPIPGTKIVSRCAIKWEPLSAMQFGMLATSSITVIPAVRS